jgi:hypothetical protein
MNRFAAPLLIIVVLLSVSSSRPPHAAETSSPASLYWCPSQAGHELQVSPAAGCEPLIETKKESERKTSSKTAGISADLEQDVAAFLRQYREFLSCCTTDVSRSDEVRDLEDQADALLRAAGTNLTPAALLASRNQALIVPVAHARHKLKALRRQLEEISAAQEALQTLDYESAARERRRLEEAQEALRKDVAVPDEPRRASTGAEIGTSGQTGPAIGSSASTGTSIGRSAPTGSVVGTTPPTLSEGHSSGEIAGSEIGTTPPTGPAIGHSSLNKGR